MKPPSIIGGTGLSPTLSDGDMTCSAGGHEIPKGEPIYVGFSDYYCMECAIQNAETLSFLAGCASQEGEGWLPIDSAPKDQDTPILVYYDHDADPYDVVQPDGRRLLTDYAVHAELDCLRGTGIALVVWRESYEETEDWESGITYTMPACWFEYAGGDAGAHAVNPIMWKPVKLPFDAKKPKLAAVG